MEEGGETNRGTVKEGGGEQYQKGKKQTSWAGSNQQGKGRTMERKG